MILLLSVLLIRTRSKKSREKDRLIVKEEDFHLDGSSKKLGEVSRKETGGRQRSFAAVVGAVAGQVRRHWEPVDIDFQLGRIPFPLQTMTVAGRLVRVVMSSNRKTWYVRCLALGSLLATQWYQSYTNSPIMLTVHVCAICDVYICVCPLNEKMWYELFECMSYVIRLIMKDPRC